MIKVLENRELRFLLVGGFNTVSGYLITNMCFFLLVPITGLIAVLVVTNVLNVTISFLTYKFFVFRTTAPWFREYLKFYGVSSVPIILSFVILPLLIDGLKLNPYFAIAVFTVFTVIMSYLGHKYVSFRKPDPQV